MFLLDPIFWIKAAQLILALSILIVLHEGGHFLFARLFKIKVEKFYLFFDYKFHLISTHDKWVQRLFPRLAKLETEYGIGWIPLGGYVKIAGMIDESMDTEQMKQPAQPWEFRTKPAWQRLLVMLGGVMVNFVLALVLYAAILFTWGRDVLPMENIIKGFWFNETAREMGFEQGDLPYSADGKVLEYFNAVELYTAACESKQMTVIRNGEKVELQLPGDGNLLEVVKQNPPLMAPLVPSVVDSVIQDSPAWKAGLRKGAQLTAFEGTEIGTWNEFDAIVGRRADVLAAGCSAADSLSLRNVSIAYILEGDTLLHECQLTLNEDYTMGIIKSNVMSYAELKHLDYSLLGSIPAGTSYGIDVLASYVSQLKYLFSKEGATSVGSFGTIGNLFPPMWDWQIFWNMTAFLSIILFFMNLLPIPALDGGHALFCIWEMITGKEPSEKFLERAQWVGMTLLMLLMALALFNDFVRFVF